MLKAVADSGVPVLPVTVLNGVKWLRHSQKKAQLG
jgi:hypothetical protein